MPPSRRCLSAPAEALGACLGGLQAVNPPAWQAFLWLAVLARDAAIAAPAAATLWGVSDAQADRLLEELSGRMPLQLREPVTAGGRVWSGYRMPADLHAELVERYRARSRGGAWHTLDDDGYIHAHLAAHLARVGRLDDLHTLLREETSGGQNGWYAARKWLGQIDGYLADVRLAWRAARRRPPSGS